jgi:hypothetical protein
MNGGEAREVPGSELVEGLPVELEGGLEVKLVVR